MGVILPGLPLPFGVVEKKLLFYILDLPGLKKAQPTVTIQIYIKKR
jgi:hypothetical protein